MKNIFAYGTLMFDEILKRLTGKKFTVLDASLQDYKRMKVKERRGPAIIKKKGAKVEGKLILNIDDHSMELIDYFEKKEYLRIKGEVLSESKIYDADFYLWNDSEEMLEDGWTPDMIDKDIIFRFIDKIKKEFKY